MPHHPENCREIFALLSQYLDLELPDDACEDIEKHLAGCPPCEEFLESLRNTVALCREYLPEAVPRELSASARTELEAAWKNALASRQR